MNKDCRPLTSNEGIELPKKDPTQFKVKKKFALRIPQRKLIPHIALTKSVRANKQKKGSIVYQLLFYF